MHASQGQHCHSPVLLGLGNKIIIEGSIAIYISVFTCRGFFVFYAGMTLMSMLYLYKFFPETKGLSLEQITDLFERLPKNNEVDTHDNQAKSAFASGDEISSPIINTLELSVRNTTD